MKRENKKERSPYALALQRRHGTHLLGKKDGFR